MADRRMLSKKITDHDNFVSLSASAQALYMHLCMSADDDGFCNQVSLAMFKAHAGSQDLEALISKKYIYQFESGVVVIKHWKLHNCIRGDRKKDTVYQEEFNQLLIKENGSYSFPAQIPKNNPNETPRQRAYRLSSLPYSFDSKIRKAFQGKECPICGSKMQIEADEGIISNYRIPTIQHNIPISKGGQHELGNISVICKHCNVSNQNKITGPLNADEVIDVWQKICNQKSGQTLVDTCPSSDRIEQDSIGKNSISSSSKGDVDFLDLLTNDEIASLKDLYIDHYDLIDACQRDANIKHKTIRKPFSYIVGYAANTGWPER